MQPTQAETKKQHTHEQPEASNDTLHPFEPTIKMFDLIGLDKHEHLNATHRSMWKKVTS